MSRQTVRSLAVLAVALAALGCPKHHEVRSNALEYLYPSGKAFATPPTDVTLKVPVRVGIAFAPLSGSGSDAFTDLQKQTLLNRLADAFKDRPEIASVEVIPRTYLSAAGGFDELNRVSQAFGVNLVSLVSYNQIQFSETTRSNWAYWTLVGAYVVKGEKNETRTLMDAAIYDLESRTLLFRAAGDSSLQGKSTPVDVDRKLRQRSEQGFDEAMADLIQNLKLALADFSVQAASGTVRGEGTPAVTLVDPSGKPILASGGGGGGGGWSGSAGLPELAAALALAALGIGARRRA